MRLFALFLFFFAALSVFADQSTANGWLIIHGGGELSNEAKERFVALAGGPAARYVMIPTAMRDSEIPGRSNRMARLLGITNYTELHTRDRSRANSDGFVEPLRHASAVWIDGGRQWRLVDVYLGTAVEREIKTLVARGGVVFGSSAGATIQGSFLVRGSPGTTANPDGDNRIMMAPGYETGFGLLANSAIDQHIDARGRVKDLDSVIAEHHELLGIGIDQGAAIVVHGDSFFVVSGQVAIHDESEPYYFLSAGQSFNLKTRSADESETALTLAVLSATRSAVKHETVGTGLLGSKQINYACEVSLYSVGRTIYPIRSIRPHKFEIQAREVDSDQLRYYACNY